MVSNKPSLSSGIPSTHNQTKLSLNWATASHNKSTNFSITAKHFTKTMKNIIYASRLHIHYTYVTFILCKNYIYNIQVLLFVHTFSFLIQNFRFQRSLLFNHFHLHVQISASDLWTPILIVRTNQHLIDLQGISKQKMTDFGIPLRALWIRWFCQESSNNNICSNRSRYGRSS